MNKICVTGNHGFIGRALHRLLQSKGHIPLGIEQWIFDRGRWEDMLLEYVDKLNPDAVFHVGAISDTRCVDAEKMLTRNALSTMLLSDWCKEHSKPFIYSSSAAVTGTTGHPDTLYAMTKYIGERFALANGQVALRYFNVYGDGEHHKGKMASVACQAYMKCKWGEPFTLFPGSPSRDFVYVDDVVEANVFALENYQSLKGKSYDVGSGCSRTFEEVLDMMKLGYVYSDPGQIPEGYQTFTKADENRFMPGWMPRFQLEDAIPKYLALLRISSADPSLL